MGESMLEVVVRRLNECKGVRGRGRGEVSWYDIEAKTGISYSTIQRIASGATPDPGFTTVEKIHAFFVELDAQQSAA